MAAVKRFFALLIISSIATSPLSKVECMWRRFANGSGTFELSACEEDRKEEEWFHNGTLIATRDLFDVTLVLNIGENFLSVRSCLSNVRYQYESSNGEKVPINCQKCPDDNLRSESSRSEKHLWLYIALLAKGLHFAFY